MSRLPPMGGPHPLMGLSIDSYTIGSWCPSPDGTGKPEAVAISLKLNEFPCDLVLRLKSPSRVDELIQALLRHKRDVWPDAP